MNNRMLLIYTIHSYLVQYFFQQSVMYLKGVEESQNKRLFKISSTSTNSGTRKRQLNPFHNRGQIFPIEPNLHVHQALSSKSSDLCCLEFIHFFVRIDYTF